MSATRLSCFLYCGMLIVLFGEFCKSVPCSDGSLSTQDDCVKDDIHFCQSCSQEYFNNSCTYSDPRESPLCRCDPLCELYGDCCPSRPAECSSTSEQSFNTHLSHEFFTCTNVVIDQNQTCNLPRYIWIVSQCPESWTTNGGTDQETVNKECVLGSSSLPPVTEKSSGVVYRNLYCALCNKVLQDDLTSWSVSFKCSKTLEDILSEINAENTSQSINIFNRYCSPKEFVEPDTVQSSRRSCLPFRSASCLDRHKLINVTGSEWNIETYSNVVSRCIDSEYQNLVIGNMENENLVDEYLDFDLPYRNEYCALCNGMNLSSTECFTSEGGFGCIAGTSFSVLFDIHGDGSVVVHTEHVSTTVQVDCLETQVYDPVIEGCRKKIAINIDHLFAPINDTIKDCNGSLIVLNETDYFTLTERSMVHYGGEVYVVLYNTTDNHPVICVDFISNGTKSINSTIDYYSYPIGYTILSNVGCSLSVVSCFLVILTYLLFKDIRTFPGRILMILSLVILLSNLLFLASGPLTDGFPDSIDLCVAIAILLHLLFLLQFSWMSIMSFEITRTLYLGTRMKLKDTVSYKRWLFVRYLIGGCGVPVLIVVIAVIVNFSTDGLVLYGVYEDMRVGSCWINHAESAVIAFVVPLAISIIINMFLFVFATVLLCDASRTQAKLGKKKNVSYFRVNFAVFSVSGMTWLFGFIAILARSQWAWYPFIVLNSTQGVTIFIAFVFTKRVFKLYIALLTCKKKSLSRSSRSTFRTQTSFRSQNSFRIQSSFRNGSSSTDHSKNGVSLKVDSINETK